MFGGRICGCYILSISLEKQRKRPPFVFNYLLRTDGRATGGAQPNATRNWCFVEVDGVYVYCFEMIVHGFPEASTDTIWVFYFFTETSILRAQYRYFDNSNVKPPRRNRVGGKWEHQKASVKMHTNKGLL